MVPHLAVLGRPSTRRRRRGAVKATWRRRCPFLSVESRVFSRFSLCIFSSSAESWVLKMLKNLWMQTPSCAGLEQVGTWSCAACKVMCTCLAHMSTKYTAMLQYCLCSKALVKIGKGEAGCAFGSSHPYLGMEVDDFFIQTSRLNHLQTNTSHVQHDLRKDTHRPHTRCDLTASPRISQMRFLRQSAFLRQRSTPFSQAQHRSTPGHLCGALRRSTRTHTHTPPSQLSPSSSHQLQRGGLVKHGRPVGHTTGAIGKSSQKRGSLCIWCL